MNFSDLAQSENGLLVELRCHNAFSELIFTDIIYYLKEHSPDWKASKVKCPYCGREEVVLYGKSRTGKQRLLCRNPACSHKIFQLEYANNACKPGTKENIVEMAMNGAGVRDTGRVLDISPNTVTAVLKKRENSQNQSTGSI